MGDAEMAERMSGMDAPDLGKGVLAGAIGGLAASWAMTQFQALWSRAAGNAESASAGGRHDAREWQERSEDQNATELVAQAVARAALGRPLSREELAVAAPAVHYGFGTTMGALYGGLAELRQVGVGDGAAWGTAIWIAGDEIAVPLLGLSRAPQSYSPDAHAQALASHVVFGVAAEIVRRRVRAML